MNGIPKTLHALVSFDHYCWLLLIIWFAAAIVFTSLGSPVGPALSYSGIIFVLATNLIRLLYLMVHFHERGSRIYERLTVLLISAMVASILFQLWIRR